MAQDFTTGCYFNRVIDDSKASDNTRHLARHPVTGEPFLLPPDRIRRVLLVSGAVSLLCRRVPEMIVMAKKARHQKAQHLARHFLTAERYLLLLECIQCVLLVFGAARFSVLKQDSCFSSTDVGLLSLLQTCCRCYKPVVYNSAASVSHPLPKVWRCAANSAGFIGATATAQLLLSLCRCATIS